MKQRDEKFNELVGIAYTVAKKIADKYNELYEDMASEAVTVLLSYLNGDCPESWNYDPEKSAKESTWLHAKIYWYLQNVLAREKIRKMPTFNCASSDGIEAKPHWLSNLFRELSEEGKALVGIIVKAPQEIAQDVSPATYGRARRAIQTYMLENRHWDRAKFFRIWYEVKAVL